MGLVKGKIAICVQRLNYMKSYCLLEWEYTKSEEKLLLIKIFSSQKEKFEAYIKKNHPYKCPELIYIEPKEINAAYLACVLPA